MNKMECENNEEPSLVCRVCLLPSDCLHSDFEVIPGLDINISTMLENFSICVESTQAFVSNYCSNCVEDLKAGYRFIENFKRSQEILKEHPEIFTPKIEFIDPACKESIQGDEFIDTTSKESIHEVAKFDDVLSEINDEEDLLIQQSVKLTKLFRKHKLDLPEEEEAENELSGVDEITEHIVNPRIIRPKVNVVENLKTTSSFPCNNSKCWLCPLCWKPFKNFSPLEYHLKEKHSKKKRVTCNECSLPFNNYELFITHFKETHRYQCKFCRKSFPRCDTYTRHIQTHTNSLPKFLCPVENCSKSFTRKQSLQYHMTSVHNEKRNFLCNQCGASFKTYDNLRYHIKKHNGPSHVCSYCGKAYMLAVHLRYHMWRHTGVKPFNCEACKKSFINKKLLNLHLNKCVESAN